MDKKTIHNYGNYAEENNGEMNVLHTKSENNKSLYSQWWFTSLIIGILGGGITWWQSSSWKFGLVVLVVSFLFISFFNPKKRFLRAAWGILSIATINFIPKIVGTLNIPQNDFLNGIIEIGNEMNIFIQIVLLLFSAFLFWLDHKENI
jgi:hypothetical protein